MSWNGLVAGMLVKPYIGQRRYLQWSGSLSDLIDTRYACNFDELATGYERIVRVRGAQVYHPKLRIRWLSQNGLRLNGDRLFTIQVEEEEEKKGRRRATWYHPSLPRLTAHCTVDTPLFMSMGLYTIVYKNEHDNQVHVLYVNQTGDQ